MHQDKRQKEKDKSKSKRFSQITQIATQINADRLMLNKRQKTKGKR